MSPVSINILNGKNTGTIIAIIPSGTANGAGYRIRVISNNLSIVDTDSGINLTINDCTPLITIKSTKTVSY